MYVQFKCSGMLERWDGKAVVLESIQYVVAYSVCSSLGSDTLGRVV